MSAPEKGPITTHILDTTVGRPAEGVGVVLEQWQQESSSWVTIGKGTTNKDGRALDLLLPTHSLQAGAYRLMFDTAAYFTRMKVKTFFPCVSIIFDVKDPREHYHVPLLLNPFAYSTYRGS